MSKEDTVNILLLGDTHVGKTALAHRMVEDTFQDESKSTVGVTYLSKTLALAGGSVRVQVWDTAGQVSFICFIFSW
jgi:small GTP-binding protein